MWRKHNYYIETNSIRTFLRNDYIDLHNIVCQPGNNYVIYEGPIAQQIQSEIERTGQIAIVS